MLKNCKGVIETPAVVALIIIFSFLSVGLNETAKNGVLKKNGKLIWCKMQNKGADYCDATYR